MTNKRNAVLTTGGPILAGVFGLLVSCGLVTLACSSDDKTSEFTGTSTSSSGSSTSSGGSSGLLQSSSGEPPDTGPPPICVSKEAEAIEGKRPVDIIFAIDNSVSMADETDQVEKQISVNFASIIEASGLDYRVIMLAKHGAHDPPGSPVPVDDRLQNICVKAPLSGTTCSPVPAKPAETTKFVHHNIVVNSQDAWCKILTTFNGPDDDGSHPQGWSQYLRPNAFKTFVVITDDRIDTQCNPFGAPQPIIFQDSNDAIAGTNAAGAFDSALVALSPVHFGSAAARNYKYHAIIGVAPFNTSDLTKPYPADAPINLNKCSSTTAEASGTGHQALSKLTGGLRFPTCALPFGGGAPVIDYTSIFQAMAQDVLTTSSVACDYAMPGNPDGGTIDPATAVVRYTSGATVTDFGQVANQAACVADKFYIEGDRIRLCPQSCLKVQADKQAAVKILFGCLPKDIPAQK